MPDLVLTDAQKTFFQTFGFLAFPGLIRDRIDGVIDAFEEVFKTHGGGHGGKPHEGKARSCIVPFPDKHPLLCGLIDDPRIHGLACSLLGDDFNYMAGDGNYYVGDTGWHSDGWHATTPIHIKIAFYLDPLTRDTGCLRVIPGSHIPGDAFADRVTKGLARVEENLGMPGRDIPAVALETRPGDVVVFNHNLKHAAFGGGAWRRMFTINLCQRYPAGREQDLRDYLNGWARFWLDRAYGPLMIETATPQRMRHLEQVMANDGHLAELARKARATMAEPSRG